MSASIYFTRTSISYSYRGLAGCVGEWQRVERGDFVWSRFLKVMMLVLSLAPSKRIWLLLCFYTRCLSATNVKCTCPYMAVQMFALTAQSDCVFGVCLSVCGSSDWLTSEFRMSSSCFSYFPSDHHPLLLSLYIYQAEYYTPLQLGGICKIVLKLKCFHPELTNLCLSFCHRQQIWTCVPLLAS